MEEYKFKEILNTLVNVNTEKMSCLMHIRLRPFVTGCKCRRISAHFISNKIKERQDINNPSKLFIKEFNKNVVSDEFLTQCHESSKIFNKGD